jgi:hypothetical protein
MAVEDELRRLRSRVATLEDDKRVLEERLAFAWQEVGRIRAKLLEVRPSFHTAAPGSRRVDVEPVTGAALSTALSVL